MRLLVSGSRSFSSYAVLASALDRLLYTYEGEVSIVGGACAATDALAIRYAADRGLPIYIHPAIGGGASAGSIRMLAAVAAASHVVIFYDGVSTGAALLRRFVVAAALPLRIVPV